MAKTRKSNRTRVDEVQFLTQKGYLFDIFGLTPFQIELAEQGIPRPQPPTYQIDPSLVVGNKPAYETLTEKNLVIPGDPDATAKNQAAWANYLAEINRYNENVLKAIIDAGLTTGSRLAADSPQPFGTFEQWKTKQLKSHRPLPTYDDGDVDDEAAYILWCKTVCFADMSDVIDFHSVILEKSGMRVTALVEGLKKADAIFRGDVERPAAERSGAEGESRSVAVVDVYEPSGGVQGVESATL